MPQPPESRWLYKENLTLLAGIAETWEEVVEVHTFCVDNPLPGHRFHAELPPYPSLEGDGYSFRFYFDRGNPIAVVRDQDRVIWGMAVFPRNLEAPLWLHVRREPISAHNNQTLSDNSEKTVAHLAGLRWAMKGEVTPIHIPGDPENLNKNIQRIDHDRIRAFNIEVFNALYAPAYGLPTYSE